MEADNSTAGKVNHPTELVQAVSLFSRTRRHQYDLRELIERARQAQQHDEDLSTYDGLIRERLAQAVFVGHINTDMDSVAGAIGAAALFGGTPAISEAADSLNGEILFALKNCGIETPTVFDELENSATCDVVLVDHTEEKQMVPSIVASPNRATRIIGILDHHALAKTFFTSKPIFMDLRPWGSVSTIIAILFISHKKFLPKPIALLLLHAILSDTLNLRSITTTEADKGMVALLSSYADVSNTNRAAEPSEINPALDAAAAYRETDIDLLAKRQFQAKTDWIVALGAYAMVRGDQKDFSSGPWKFGISVLEVTDTSKVLAIADEILLELRLLKKEKGLAIVEQERSASAPHDDGDHQGAPRFQLHRASELDFAFLFVVNIVEQTSILLIPGGRELALAKAAFMRTDDPDASAVYTTEAFAGIKAPGSTIQPADTAMHLPPGYVSRKAQFVPAFFRALEENFNYASKGPVSLATDADSKYSSADTRNVLDAIAQGKQDKPVKPDSMAIFSDAHSREWLSISAVEQAEEEQLAASQAAHALSLKGNLYDEYGRVRRSYATDASQPHNTLAKARTPDATRPVGHHHP
jgi:inorganic pyrophosphatase/exopolyphosphatase